MTRTSVQGSPTTPPLLAARGICQQFPGVRALDDVHFTLHPGEIHALLGENGAGKSTLIKVLTGVYRPDAGQLLLAGRPIAPRSPLDAQRLGISTVYQEVNLVPHLSVAENLLLGRQPRRAGLIRWGALRRRAVAALRRLDLDLDVTRPLSSYSLAIQQMVAIARALDVDARVLILDEPTSSLDRHEVAELFTVMRKLRDQGLGIIFITHFLDQVYAVADHLTVLRNGRLAAVFGDAGQPLPPRLDLVATMLGQDVAATAALAARRPAPAPPPAAPLLATRALRRRPAIGPVDLAVGPGEVLGLAGLLGSGRTELARLLFGIDRADDGTLHVAGRRVRLRGPRAAIALGFGYCPEDRKTAGILPRLSVRENIALALQARRGWWRPLGRRGQLRLADEFIRALNIATPDSDKAVGELSGGTQQKVILARWLAARPRLLILDEPTRGIDVGAKAEIERLVARLCRDGLALVFISSELEEVVRSATRVLVLREGRAVGTLAGDAIELPRIMQLIAGAEATP